MNTEAITSIKGIGEKTARLFQKLGVETVEDLLHYYTLSLRFDPGSASYSGGAW